MRALFPISLNNQAFSTNRVLPALPHVFTRYNEVVFLVADHLQLYNKALRVADGLSLSRIIREFTTNQHYREQRSKWVQRMTSQMQSSGHSHWTLIGIDDITDPKCFNIFRNVMLAYYSIPCFRNDVDRSARWHAQQARNSHYSADRREQLSRGYILEEIALSIRIHVINEIDDEYYMRQQSPPIVNLYHGRYEFSAFDLAEMPNDGRLIRFYYLNGSDPQGWTEQLPDQLDDGGISETLPSG